MDPGPRKRAVDLLDDDSHQQEKTTTTPKMSRVAEKVEDASAPSAAAAAPLAEDELGKLRKQLEEAQENWKEANEAVKRWAKEVEEAFEQLKKAEDPNRRDSSQKLLDEAKESLKTAEGREVRLLALVDKLKAEIAFKVAGKTLID